MWLQLRYTKLASSCCHHGKETKLSPVCHSFYVLEPKHSPGVQKSWLCSACRHRVFTAEFLLLLGKEFFRLSL